MALQARKRPLVKIIVIGDSGVGKTAMLDRYINNRFLQMYRSTIGADFHQKELMVDSQRVTAQFWDTAGQERFRSLNTGFYRDTDCCILVFDVTRLATFNSLDSWLNEFRKNRNESHYGEIPIVLIGNKVDKEENIQVTEEQALKWCRSHSGIPYFEVSSLSGYQIETAFKTIVKCAANGHLFARKVQKVDVDLQAIDKEDNADKKTSPCC